jgi:hypothetical protein
MNWGDDKQFAVRDAHFQSYNAEKKYSGMHFVEFSKGPESSGGPLTCTVTFLADGRSMTVVPPPGGANRAAPKAPSPDDDAGRTSPSSGDAPTQAAPPSGKDSPN